MKAGMVPKRKWFQHATNSGEILVGKDVVIIENGDGIDHSMNDDGNHESYHLSRRVEFLSGKDSEEVESIDDFDSKKYHHGQNYGKVQEEGYENCEQYKKQKSRSSRRDRVSVSSQLNSKRRQDSNHRIQKNHTVSETSGFGFLMKEDDCIDTTFDSIESYACKERTSEIFPAGARPPSPIVLYKQQQILDNSSEKHDINVSKNEKTGKNVYLLENNAASNDGYEFEQVSNSSNSGLDYNISTGYCSSGISSGGFGFIAGKIGELLLSRENQPLNKITDELDSDHLKNGITTTANKSLSITLNTTDSDLGLSQSNDETSFVSDQAAISDLQQKEQLKSDVFSSRINRENSLRDVELAGNSEEHSFSTSPLEKNNQDRLEQLRQSKRAIEQERLRLSQNQSQTIVLPRSSLYYCSEEENIEETKSCTSIIKLQSGSSVTTKQSDLFYFHRKVSLTATISLISIGILILAIALFWPAKIL